ncbi:hypothetical protein NYP18_09045 [Corynebacterium sp. YIM 101645]|uniref:DUF7352 domain-containing protein n=1 Tax=Corynebacterium lemuris TaxID=1859292 RepID=A0ABT2FX32_9CORY|nr:hypothetical protein [Corynebacterium lemuris]MCS5479805.1 hypothetical protein [Corynebacterium lemuris]
MSDVKAIWKFTIPVTDVVEVEMPRNARVLPFVQPARPESLVMRSMHLWAEVYPDAPKIIRRFLVVGTGNPIPDAYPSHWLASVVDPPFVWHVYEASDPITGVGGEVHG